MSKLNTITHRPISKRYKSTDIMHVIGKQSEPMKLYMENETCREEIETILSAPGHSMTTLALDMFALGMMYGKRAERSKRKDPWTKEGRNIKLTLHCVPLPETVKGVSVKKAGKGDKYLILLNSTKSEEQRAATFLHECLHIYHGDHDRPDLTADQVEAIRHREIMDMLEILKEQ